MPPIEDCPSRARGAPLGHVHLSVQYLVSTLLSYLSQQQQHIIRCFHSAPYVRLERRGLEHPEECPLCCQESETTSHLTLQCSFSRQVWYNILIQRRLHRFTPTAKSEIATWWSSLSEAVPKKHRKEVNALIILVARSMAGEKQQGLRQICYPAHGTLLQNQG
jgi:hypothetical protein